MREIKFRAWVGREKMEYLPELQEDGVEFAKQYKKLDQERGGAFLMQFTGLFDKKGKEIYEGDVFEFPEKNEFGSMTKIKLAVMWCDHEGNWALSRTPEDPENPHYIMSGQVRKREVIGNIYENPELIKHHEATK